MPKSSGFRHVLVSLLIAVSVLAQGTWALAGTTGGVSSTVVDADSGTPVANATVTVQGPSQTAIGKTDANGHVSFLSLAPDTYTVSASAIQYTPASIAGVTVFADSVQTVAVSVHRSLKTIAAVRTRASSGLVKPGTTADVYSVNAATQDKISALGGGGSLNSAYAAVASVPGVVVPFNQTGYFQTVHIRGGDYDQVGYEFDGVPVNRSFDNYPSGALSSLGMAELQVYTGATPATSEGQGLAGYINQVIKVGTFPGFGDLALGIGGPTFYHKASVEAGGASPNRMFSYYVGVGGYNQDLRYVDQKNGATYTELGAVLQVAPNACNDASAVNYVACYANGVAGPGGFVVGPYNWGQPSGIADRDAVVNLRFGIPHKYDGGHDDVQLLWDSALLHTSFYDSVADAAGAYAPGTQPTYIDGFSYSGPVGQVVNAATLGSDVSRYYFPNQPSHAANMVLPSSARDTSWNNQEIAKLQYQKNMGSDAYFRLYGYTYYSDWLDNGPMCGYVGTKTGFICPIPGDYELSSHTRGLSAQFEKQLSSANLLSFEANYTTATSTRDNNTQFANGTKPVALLVDGSNPTNGICYSVSGATATPVSCLVSDKQASRVSWQQAYASAHGGAPISDYTSLTCGSGPCS